MLTLLLIFCLALNGSNSCRHTNKNVPPPSSQYQGSVLTSLLEQVDSCEEPALRVFLRLKLATYLWSKPAGSLKPETIATTALAELRDHEKEIPALYVDQFRKNLIAQLQLHAPELVRDLAENNNPESRTDLEVAYSLLGQEKGNDQAVRIVQDSIGGGKDPGSIIVPFLHRLETIKSSDVSKILTTVISQEETQPGSISSGTLFRLKHLFIRKQTSEELQNRYLVVVVHRAEQAEGPLASVVDTYTILVDLLPEVEKRKPDLYYSASVALTELAKRVPKATLDRVALDKRVRASNDPLAQLMSEMEAVTDLSLKEDLQIEASQIALEKGQIQLAINLVVKLKPKNEQALVWRDQFIEKAVVAAIDGGDIGTAELGARQIRSASVRSSAMQKVALYFQKSNKLGRAHEALLFAQDSVNTLGDSNEKAVALLNLANSYLKIDSSRSMDLARAAIKIINKAFNEGPASKQSVQIGGDQQLTNAESMLIIAYRLMPTFQLLGATDESAALDLAKDIQRQELRIAATFGAYSHPPTGTVQGVAQNNR